MEPVTVPVAGSIASTLGERSGVSDEIRLRLGIAYDGAGFSGWAVQPGLRTVQGEIQDALGRILRLSPAPELTVAGRTDAGVHAQGQVAHVDVPRTAWEAVGASAGRRLAGVLPADVRVTAIAPAAYGFDARFSALARRYVYRVGDHPYGVDPVRRADTLWHKARLDTDAMNAAAAPLTGEHDFAAYCRKREGATTIRRLLRLEWARVEPYVVAATVEADAFCHNMVRALVGAMLAVGDGRRPVAWPAEVLAAGVRDSAVHVVPAHGLTLAEVRYPGEADLAARARETRRVRTL